MKKRDKIMYIWLAVLKNIKPKVTGIILSFLLCAFIFTIFDLALYGTGTGTAAEVEEITLISNANMKTNYEVDQQQQQQQQTRAQSSDPARLEIEKTVNREQMFVEGSGLTPESATVTLTLRGVGYPGVEFNPQDTVFIMDNSDSMDENDNEFKRIEALKLYLQNMLAPDDRAAVVRFDSKAELLNDHHLTSNYTQIIEDLPELWHTAGLTNLGAAVALANQELIDYGEGENKVLVEVLLTDGRPEPPENNVTVQTINEAKNNNIKIYTVGLGESHDVGLLKWISAQTGGQYYYARNASELLEIYDSISNQFRNYTAASDPDVTDGEPMVRDVIPEWIHYDPESFTIAPDYIGTHPGNTIRLEWNISKLRIGDTWSVSYNITSSATGEAVAISVYGHARARYLTQTGDTKELWFNELEMNVLPRYSHLIPGPPPPPPPPPVPPPPPPAGFPIPAPTPTTPVPISMQPPMYVPAGATSIPWGYMVGTFAGLGVAGVVKQSLRIKSRQKVAIGV